MKWISFLCLVFSLATPGLALDREAFTFTRYELNASIDAGQQRFGVRGEITVRNDSGSPQKNIALQISSSLHWLSIQAGGKPAEFVTQTYTSDIDHTGALSEAIVTVTKAIAPQEAIELTIGYEGVIQQDATRLTRIGIPADSAKHSDWDQISTGFTAVRGMGFVAWYPIASEAANMSDASSVSQAVGRWQQRENGAQMSFRFSQTAATTGATPLLFCNDEAELSQLEQFGQGYQIQSRCTFSTPISATPFFVIGSYQKLENPAATIAYLSEHKSGADDYLAALNQVGPSVSVWLGGHAAQKSAKPRVIDIPDKDAAPFESGDTLLMPLTADETSMLLMAAQQSAEVNFSSPRVWISQGLARYVQARYVEQEKNRETALTYLRSHRSALIEAESQGGQGTDAAAGSLINSPDEFYVESKAMNVWWMLRDLVGETSLTAALHNYKAEEDKDAMYVQRLLEAQSHRDLTWFFNDWVYRDRGLPDFRIASVFVSPIVGGGFMVTVTVENLGGAAAEVPVTLEMASGQSTQKLIIAGKSKGSVRIIATSDPAKAVVNADGAVPESDMSNNAYRIESLTQ